MCHNYALVSGPPWLKPLPRLLLSPFCCSWAPNDDVTAILPVVFSYHTLESLYVTVCPSKLVKGSMYGFRTSFRTFDLLGCDLENVECLKRDVYNCTYTCIFCVYLFITLCL